MCRTLQHLEIYTIDSCAHGTQTGEIQRTARTHRKQWYLLFGIPHRALRHYKLLM